MKIERDNFIHALEIEAARRSLKYFVEKTEPNYEFTQFHLNYLEIVNRFAHGKIKKLIVTVPPQHGKSLISTINLPSYIFGINPNAKIAIASYSSTFASKFNRLIQRKIDEKNYSEIFPSTKLSGTNVVTVADNYLRNSEEFEIVNHTGSLKAVGRGGSLTGNPVDIMIMDDLYKDYAEGNSPTIRESVWDWYLSVVLTRLHNDSQQLIVFTRWHEDDLIGRLEKREVVITIDKFEQLENIPKNAWVKINFEAIKRTEKTEIDCRDYEGPLFESKHSYEKLIEQEKLNKHGFACLYQGNPTSAAGLLYSTFKTYSEKKYIKKISKNYTDTADSGDNMLCSICYDVGTDGNIYVTDVIYTDEGMEKTENYVSAMLTRNDTNVSDIESNNGGKSFARAVDLKTESKIIVRHFHQSNNKESRIISNQPAVNHLIHMPEDWHIRWSLFYEHLTSFKKLFTANKFDDSADAITGVIEKHNDGNKIGIIW